MEKIPQSGSVGDAADEPVKNDISTERFESYARMRQAVEYLQEDHNASRALEQKKVRGNYQPWLVYDVPLAFEEGEPLESMGYDKFFAGVLNGKKIETYLHDVYGERALNVAEFGGPFRKASRDLGKKVNVQSSLGVTLVDHRDEEEKWTDAEYAHSVVEGDIFLKNFKETDDGPTKQGLGAVNRWINKNGKIDFLIVRLIGPLLSFMHNSVGQYPKTVKEKQASFTTSIPDVESMQYVFFRSFTKWYETLSADGTILMEAPGDVEKLIQTLRDMFVDENGNQLFEIRTELVVDREVTVEDLPKLRRKEVSSKDFPSLTRTLLLLRRLPGSPDKLSINELMKGLK